MTIDATGFDRDFYLAKNPDVAAAGVDPYQHYLQHGWREGRDPNAIFDTNYYLQSYPDVAAAGIDPLAHYMQNGWIEGRDPSRAFDTSEYRMANPDVAAARVNPMAHYLLHGQFEHRALALDYTAELREGFDRAYYLAANPDVAKAGVDPYIHYQSFGSDEGRRPNNFFDKDFYLLRNPDVAAAGVDAFQHFLTFGWREGRDPSADFSLSDYRRAVGTTENENPLLNYLAKDRYSDLPFELTRPNAPQIIQARGNALSAVLAGQATFTIDRTLTHVTATSSPLDGHDLSGFAGYSLSRSTADITISGTGRLPTFIGLGTGDDRLSGVFNLDGQILNLFAGAGTLSVNVQLDNGFASLNGGSGGSDVVVSGSAGFSFTGGAGADVVTSGGGDDALSGGGGVNRLDGGAGKDIVSWTTQVRADLMTGRAVSIEAGPGFTDTLVSIENLGGSPFDDILLGDEGANRLYGVNFSPSVSGNDFLAGRGGDDVLSGGDGADILIGGRGSDVLIGGEGNDLLIDAADPWGLNYLNPSAIGNEGNDRFVYLLGASGDEGRGSSMDGGTGADTYIIDPSRGGWGALALQFSQIDGDQLDLSALRTSAGDIVTIEYIRSASSSRFYGSTTIDLSAFEDVAGNILTGRITLNGVLSASDLDASDFIFASGMNWRALVPAELMPFT